MHSFKIRMTMIMVGLILAIDIYSWQALKTIFRNSSPKVLRRVKFIHFGITIICAGVALAFLLIPSYAMNKPLSTYSSSLIFILYLSKFLLALFVLIDDIRRFFTWIVLFILRLFRGTESRKKNASSEIDSAIITRANTEISRSQFLMLTGTIAAGVPLILLTKGIFKGAYDYQIHRHKLFIKNLPQAFEGLKLLQISDVHSGSFMNKDAVKRGINMIKNEKADLIFFTGDIVNNRTEEVYDYQDIFAEIKAPMGVFSTLGNHDYGDYVSNWKDPEEKVQNLKNLVNVHHDMGWQLMRNTHEIISRANSKLGIVGVENWGDRGRFQKYGDVDKAMKGMQDVPVKLLLSHDPSHWDAVIRKNHPDIDVMFAGHTHGMQFGVESKFFRWSPSQYMYPQWAGLYQNDKQQLYVNRGFGFLGYPGRVGILPEISVFTLHRGQA